MRFRATIITHKTEQKLKPAARISKMPIENIAELTQLTMALYPSDFFLPVCTLVCGSDMF